MAVILVVDDDEGIRGLVSALLKSAGHQIVTAANGAEAVAVYRSFTGQIELVITDLNMPVMDGVQAILRMRMTKPDARFIWMTANPEGFGLKEVVLLNKPFSVETVFLSIHELLQPSERPFARTGSYPVRETEVDGPPPGDHCVEIYFARAEITDIEGRRGP